MLLISYPRLENLKPIHLDFRSGDIRHSQASIKKAMELLGYLPKFSVANGLGLAMPWYVSRKL